MNVYNVVHQLTKTKTGVVKSATDTITKTKNKKMSSKIIKQELDSFDLDLLELDEIEYYYALRLSFTDKRNILLEMIKADNLGYHLNELREIINEYDNK
jgi:hypothetical protein